MKKVAAIVTLSILVLLLQTGSLTACRDNKSEDQSPTSTMNAGNGDGRLKFTPTKLPDAAVGQEYQATINVSGNRTPVGQISIDSGTLPSGLNLRFEKGTSAAVINGTPQEAGTFKLTIGAWCMGTNQAGQTGHQNYELSVK